MYLLDTHVIYWALRGSEKLPEKVKYILEKEDCCISIASLWEMSIKNALGKLELNRTCREIAAFYGSEGIPLLSITPDDCDILNQLPFHHKDPFDRIIIAQAITNKCQIVTKDHIIQEYDVQTVWE